MLVKNATLEIRWPAAGGREPIRSVTLRNGRYTVFMSGLEFQKQFHGQRPPSLTVKKP